MCCHSAVLSGSAQAQSNLFSAEAKQKGEALLKQMNLDEKVGQLNQPSGLAIPPLGEKQDEFRVKEKMKPI